MPLSKLKCKILEESKLYGRYSESRIHAIVEQEGLLVRTGNTTPCSFMTCDGFVNISMLGQLYALAQRQRTS